MRKIVFITLLLLLLPSQALAQERFVPQDKGSIDAEIVFIGGVSSTAPLKELNVSLYALPTTASSYDVSIPYVVTIDEQGNELLTLKWSDVSDASYEITARVSNNARLQGAKRVEFPYNPPASVLSYLSPTEKAVVTAEIREKALELTQGAENGFEAVTALSTWIHNNLDYDRAYSGKFLDAQQVFDKKVGVCAEYTTLMVSMSRAVGVPARSVGGVIYGPDGTWGYHAWAEVYLDGWVPVDPTWNEIGWLDALHIELGKFEDTGDQKTEVRYVYNPVQRPSITIDEPKVSVDIQNSDDIRKIFDTQATTFPESVGVGDSAVVEVTTTNSADGCIATSTDVISAVDERGIDAVSVTEPVAIAVCPGETVRSHFVLKVRDDLPPIQGYYFNLARIRTFLGGDVTTDLKASPQDDERSNLDLRVERTTAKHGDRIGFEVVTDAQEFKVYSDLPMSGDVVVAEKTGVHYIIAATSTGEVEREEIVIKKDLPFLVKNVDKPSSVECGEAFNVTFDVESLKDFFQELDVRTTVSDELERVGPFDVRVERGETEKISVSTRLVEECSGKDQFVSVSVGDQRVHEPIDVEVKGTTAGALRSIWQRIIDFIISFFT